MEQIQVKIFKTVFGDFCLVLSLCFLRITMPWELRELDSKHLHVCLMLIQLFHVLLQCLCAYYILQELFC